MNIKLSTWLLIFFLFLAWSAVAPHDRLTWWLEASPALLALFVLVGACLAQLFLARLHDRQLDALERN